MSCTRALDLDAWDSLGRDMVERDPIRFAEMISLARRIVGAHSNPMATPLGAGVCVPMDLDDTNRSG